MNLVEFLYEHKEALGDALLGTRIAALGLGVAAEFVFSVTLHTSLLSVRAHRKIQKKNPSMCTQGKRTIEASCEACIRT